VDLTFNDAEFSPPGLPEAELFPVVGSLIDLTSVALSELDTMDNAVLDHCLRRVLREMREEPSAMAGFESTLLPADVQSE
jgi:FXSXX-COOH protein